MRRFLLIILPLLAGCHLALAQLTITGKVTDETGQGLPQVTVVIKGTTQGQPTNADGEFRIVVPSEKSVLVFRFLGYATKEVRVGGHKEINVQLQPEVSELDEVVVTALGITRSKASLGYSVTTISVDGSYGYGSYGTDRPYRSSKRRKRKKNRRGRGSEISNYEIKNESYAKITENGFNRVDLKPLSTFSIDVDRASYSNVRRMLNDGDMPPKDAVRIEEMINYFSYDYEQTNEEHPFGLSSEIGVCPWKPEHKLLRVGLKAMDYEADALPMRNLTFLIDISGSMSSDDKLPLAKKTMKLLTQSLNENDRVSIVVYANGVGIALKPTRGNEKGRIYEAIEELSAGGGTNGSGALRMAYELAGENYKKNAVNRIILATDGDFNIGESTDADMEKLITEEKERGIFFTALGFGYGNLKDSKLEILADKGNGNYAYIDSFKEAKKIVMDEINSTLITVAKDVKFQVEFNPARVSGYRLIGYENRLLNDEDFNDDKKDAGEVGAGHEVTALYEIIPVGLDSDLMNKTDELKYSKLAIADSEYGEEWADLKVRYKKPDARKSIKFNLSVTNQESGSKSFQLASAVAMFGMLLRDSEHKGNSTYQQAADLVRKAMGENPEPLKSELIELIDMAAVLKINN